MKETGIVRKIDELGRIVIPIEIRRNMKIKNGDEMEMFISPEGDIIIKKHSKVQNLAEVFAEYISSLSKFDIQEAFITNLGSVVCYSGDGSKETIKGAFLSKVMERKIAERKTLTLVGDECIRVTVNDETPYKSQIICSIILAGDVYGGLVFGSTTRMFSKSELMLAEYLTDTFSQKL